MDRGAARRPGRNGRAAAGRPTTPDAYTDADVEIAAALSGQGMVAYDNAACLIRSATGHHRRADRHLQPAPLP